VPSFVTECKARVIKQFSCPTTRRRKKPDNLRVIIESFNNESKPLPDVLDYLNTLRY
jgi:hypothetical protein